MKVYLSLGSNLGDRFSNLSLAMELIEAEIGRIVQKSSVFKTESWGYSDSEYLNMCVCIECEHKPEDLISLTQSIECRLGRTEKTIRNEHHQPEYKAREIDLDILFCGHIVMNLHTCIIPHPGIPHRMFILKPLDQIAHDFIHPVMKQTVGTLLIQCTDKSYVEEYPILVNPI